MCQSDSVDREFFENIAELICTDHHISTSSVEHGLDCVVILGTGFCGLQLEMQRFECGKTFVEIDLFFLDDKPSLIDLQLWSKSKMDHFCKHMQPEIRWGQLYRENESLVFSRNEVIPIFFDHGDAERMYSVIEEMFIEYEVIYRVLMGILSFSEVTEEVIEQLLCEGCQTYVATLQ